MSDINKKSAETVNEIFMEKGIGIFDICRYWIYVYPEGIFTMGRIPQSNIVEIREAMKKILKAVGEKP